MMMKATQIEACPTSTSAISTPDTSSLSAVVSRKFPRAEVCFQRRARRPSKKSVTAANAKSAVAVGRAQLGSVSAITSAMTTGVSAIRRYVMAVRKAAARSSAVVIGAWRAS